MNKETNVEGLKVSSPEAKLPVSRSALVSIVDGDIATIEALHDLLLDEHGYQIDFITLKRARELTAKMYAALYPKSA